MSVNGYFAPNGDRMIRRMTTAPALPFDDACYLALKARDARFDGHFFTAVTSTGIYCRPVCRVRTPKRENCRFFTHAAQAELAGFRPCLRCRPELAPGGGWAGVAQAWSMQDASSILAWQAARLLDTAQGWGDNTPGVAALAQRLGISDRHLRRIFEAQFGVSPLRYLQTRRLLCAKQLLTDTRLPVAQVAHMSGFASVRRFNAAFTEHYGLQPTQLRRNQSAACHGVPQTGISLQLAYRPPYDVAAMLGFLQTRQIACTEVVTLIPRQACVSKTLSIYMDGQRLVGWLSACFDEPRLRVTLTVSESLMPVLGQQITVAAARTLGWPDAFPAGDVALHKALGVQGEPSPAKTALAASMAWQPWRSYAVIRAWASLGAADKPVIAPLDGTH